MKFQSYLKQNDTPSMALRFKKTIYKEFTVTAKFAYFALTKKGDFQDQFLITHSFMSNGNDTYRSFSSLVGPSEKKVFLKLVTSNSNICYFLGF